jgi:hypothetical protein
MKYLNKLKIKIIYWRYFVPFLYFLSPKPHHIFAAVKFT